MNEQALIQQGRNEALVGVRDVVKKAYRERDEALRWKQELEDACIINHIAFYPDDPRHSLVNLIEWETKIALDPLVSSEARALYDKGRQDALAERDEADRRAGAAERKLATCGDIIQKYAESRREMKKQAGYSDNTSFDVVWAETLALAQWAKSQGAGL